MPSRPLAALALAALLVSAGCLGGSSAPTATTAETTTSSASSTGATATDAATATRTATAEPTTRRPCSVDSNATVSSVSKPANLSREAAAEVAETVERRYQAVRVDEHTYFNHNVGSVTAVERTERGYRLVVDAELDYDRRGGPNATVVHVRRPYSVTYRVTDRRVVRRGEAGTSGTVVCW